MNTELIPIVKKVLDGEWTAYKELYEKTKLEAWFVTINIFQDGKKAEHLFRDSYNEAFGRIYEFKAEEFDDKLNEIIFRQIKNRIKQQNEQFFISPQNIYDKTILDEYIPNEFVENEKTNNIIMEIFKGLSEDERLLVILYIHWNLSVDNISSILNLSIETVSNILVKALEKIKADITNFESTKEPLYHISPLGILPSVFRHEAQQAVWNIPVFESLAINIPKEQNKKKKQNRKHKSYMRGVMIFGCIIAILIVGVVVLSIFFPTIIKNLPINHNEKESSKSFDAIQKISEIPDIPTSLYIPLVGRNAPALDEESNYTYELLDDGTAKITNYTGKAKHLILPSTLEKHSVTEIGNNIFQYAEYLESVMISQDIKNIASDAWKGCTNLKSISVDSKNTNFSSQNGVLFNINKFTLIRCPQNYEKTSYTIPESVKIIKENAFESCKNIADITLPEELQDIQSYAFFNCTALKSIEIPSKIAFIREGVFLYCTNLKNVVLSESTNFISKCAFKECIALENIDIPENVTSIAAEAFSGCTSLKTIELSENVTDLSYDTFQKCNSLTIYGKVGSYIEEYAELYHIKFVAK